MANRPRRTVAPVKRYTPGQPGAKKQVKLTDRFLKTDDVEVPMKEKKVHNKPFKHPSLKKAEQSRSTCPIGEITLSSLLKEREKMDQAGITDAYESSCDSADDADPKHLLFERILGDTAQLEKTLDSPNGPEDEDDNETDWGVQLFTKEVVPPQLGRPAESLSEDSKEAQYAIGCSLENNTLTEAIEKEGVCSTSTFNGLYHYLTHGKKSLSVKAFDCLHNLLFEGEEIQIQALPSFDLFMTTLKEYGYKDENGGKILKVSREIVADAVVHLEGAPHNIRLLLELLTDCCLCRSRHAVFTCKEAQELIVVMGHLLHDPTMRVYKRELDACIGALLHFFDSREWKEVASTVPRKLARLGPRSGDNVQLVENLPCGSEREKLFRKRTAFEVLLGLFEPQKPKDDSPSAMLLLLTRTEGSHIDYHDILHKVQVARIWLSHFEKTSSSETSMWKKLLLNLKSSISPINLAPYASELRNLAATLEGVPDVALKPAHLT